jgi:hypothetical protein
VRRYARTARVGPHRMRDRAAVAYDCASWPSTASDWLSNQLRTACADGSDGSASEQSLRIRSVRTVTVHSRQPLVLISTYRRVQYWYLSSSTVLVPIVEYSPVPVVDCALVGAVHLLQIPQSQQQLLDQAGAGLSARCLHAVTRARVLHATIDGHRLPSQRLLVDFGVCARAISNLTAQW